jgi:flagellar basal-body rod protein FlgC
MSFFKIFEISGSAMNAQQVRLNTTASNLANVETAAGAPDKAYRAKHPVFQTMLDEMNADGPSVGVTVKSIMSSDAPAMKRYQPSHPLADDQGYIYMPNVNAIEEMANMISASRNYENNVDVMNTSKQMMLRTLSLGQ